VGYYGERDGMVDVARSGVFLLWTDRTEVRVVNDHVVFHSHVGGRHSSTFRPNAQLIEVVRVGIFPHIFPNRVKVYRES
jgi:hypothetical protein